MGFPLRQGLGSGSVQSPIRYIALHPFQHLRHSRCAGDWRSHRLFYAEAIPETGHSYVFNIVVAPSEENTGIAIGQCHCDEEETIEVELPTLNDGEYSIKVINKPTCIENGLSKYEYSLEIEGKEYTVSFELVISKIEYDPEISDASEVCVKEEISFIDPFGEMTTEVVTVVYRLFECPEENCHVLLLLEKSFVYDENLYVYSFEENEFILTLPEGEK